MPSSPLTNGQQLADSTPRRDHLTRFRPGQVANPNGRPKSSRHKLGEAFIQAMHADFQQHGDKVIEQVRIERPSQYLKVIASILPKELNVNTNVLESLDDNELAEMVVVLKSVRSAGEP